MSRTVDFTWRELRVVGVWYEGTTPAGGDDANELVVEGVYFGHALLPEWLSEHLIDEHYSEMCESAEEAAHGANG